MPLDAKNTANLTPNRRCELRSPVKKEKKIPVRAARSPARPPQFLAFSGILENVITFEIEGLDSDQI